MWAQLWYCSSLCWKQVSHFQQLHGNLLKLNMGHLHHLAIQCHVLHVLMTQQSFFGCFFFFFPLRWSHVSVKLKCIAPWADRESGGLNKIHMWLVIAAAYQMKGKKALTGAAQNSSCRSPAPGAPQPGSPCSPVPPHKVQPCRSPRGQRSRAAAGAPPAPTNPETLPSECACPLSHAEDTDLCKSRSKRNAFHSLRVAFVVVVSFFHLYRKKKNRTPWQRERAAALGQLPTTQGWNPCKEERKGGATEAKTYWCRKKNAWVNDTAWSPQSSGNKGDRGARAQGSLRGASVCSHGITALPTEHWASRESEAGLGLGVSAPGQKQCMIPAGQLHYGPTHA